jgi:hypothetical protein
LTTACGLYQLLLSLLLLLLLPGCCPAHSPLLPQGLQLPVLPPAFAALLQPLLRLLLLQVIVSLEGESTQPGGRGGGLPSSTMPG